MSSIRILAAFLASHLSVSASAEESAPPVERPAVLKTDQDKNLKITIDGRFVIYWALAKNIANKPDFADLSEFNSKPGKNLCVEDASGRKACQTLVEGEVGRFEIIFDGRAFPALFKMGSVGIHPQTPKPDTEPAKVTAEAGETLWLTVDGSKFWSWEVSPKLEGKPDYANFATLGAPAGETICIESSSDRACHRLDPGKVGSYVVVVGQKEYPAYLRR